MTLYVFLLVLFSAFCHATWNFAARKAAGNLMAVWLGLWLGCAVMLPGAIGIIIHSGIRETMQLQGITCIIATGLIHTVYFRLLAAGYEAGEISLVYPIARGSGIALTAILAGLLLREQLTLLGSIGIGLVCLGIISLSTGRHKRADDTKAIRLALCIGASIVAYSLVDKIGVSYINPVVYICSMFLIAGIALTPMLIRRYRGQLGKEARQNIGYAVIIGIGSAGTYLMILFAFTRGPVNYIVAVREFAVVLGALAGIIFLKERFTLAKALAICVIVIGILGIKLS
ncbi:MAG: DMT family transporter [Desulfobacterales bacterium]|nr:DMT family transporter [Desulfobacterales bacterium]